MPYVNKYVHTVYDFLVSTENHRRVTSLTINKDYIKNIMHYDVDMEANKNLQENFVGRHSMKNFFFEVPGSDGEELIVPAKKCRNSDISEDFAKMASPFF